MKAGVTAAIGSILATIFMAFVGMTAGLPVLFAAGIILGGYILAATLVDIADNVFEVKERAAKAAR